MLNPDDVIPVWVGSVSVELEPVYYVGCRLLRITVKSNRGPHEYKIPLPEDATVSQFEMMMQRVTQTFLLELKSLQAEKAKQLAEKAAKEPSHENL